MTSATLTATREMSDDTLSSPRSGLQALFRRASARLSDVENTTPVKKMNSQTKINLKTKDYTFLISGKS